VEHRKKYFELKKNKFSINVKKIKIMSHRFFKAVMHIVAKQINKIINLVNKVIAGLTANATIYTTPNPAVAVMTTEVNSLITLQGKAKGGGKEPIAKRDAQAVKVFGLLTNELLYVNSIAQGDKDKILLSGFDVNVQPSPVELPDKVSIKSLVIGPVDHSVKINLSKFNNPAQITRVKLRFVVDMTTDPSSEDNWDEVISTGNSRKLIIEDLTRKTEYFFRVAAVNTKGQGVWSDTSAFVAQ